MPSGDEILPLPAAHVEGSFVLRITRQRNGVRRSFFYGHDSGFYPAAALDALAKGPPVDIALFDCTDGAISHGNQGHMSVDGVVAMAGEFRRRGIVTPAGRLVATHFSHNGGLLHEELVQTFLPLGIEVAYDGMRVRV